MKSIISNEMEKRKSRIEEFFETDNVGLDVAEACFIELIGKSVLHLDADEDHVKLQNGERRIVPLVSVYEGIERIGSRGICKNVFRRAEFGKKTEELWEEVLTEMERRYDPM